MTVPDPDPVLIIAPIREAVLPETDRIRTGTGNTDPASRPGRGRRPPENLVPEKMQKRKKLIGHWSSAAS